MAGVRVFASPTMIHLFTEWGDAAKVTWDEHASTEARDNAYERAETAQHQMLKQVVEEVQGG
jgi:hypothetical protein